MRKVVDTLLPLTMVGSYPRPLWFKHQLQGRDIRSAFKWEEHAQAYEDATASVIRDQESAGLDIVTDGQMQYDDYGGSIGSFVWYWYERLPGFYHDKMLNPYAMQSTTINAKDFELFNNWGGTYTTGKIEPGPTHLAELYLIGAKHANRPVKFSVGAGPINLGFHVYYDLPESYYKNRYDLAEALVPIFNAEMKALVRAGATFLQLEDLGAWLPIMTGDDKDAAFVVDIVNRCIEGVDAKIGWHFCLGAAYGNSNQSVFGGQLERILPPLYDTKVEQFVLDFALRNMADLQILSTLPKDKEVVAGVIDVRAVEIESDEQIADRMRRVLDVVDAERVYFGTDCGMRVLPRIVAQNKLRGAARAVRKVRLEVGSGQSAGVA